MQAELLRVIEGIQQDGAIYALDEAAIKQGIILRVISCLGWDTFNVREVFPEYQIGDGRVDYSLQIGEESKVYVEAKKPSVDLHDHQGQLLRYAFEGGVKLAVLSNGLTWWFYLPLHEGDWEQRRFYSVHIPEQNAESIAERLSEFLSRDRIADNSAYQAAETLCTSQRRTQIVRETIPKVWNRIVDEADEFLVDLLRETTEEMCGFKADETEVQNFLTENAQRFSVPTTRDNEVPKHAQAEATADRNPQVEREIRAGVQVAPATGRDKEFIRDVLQLPIELQKVGEELLARVRSAYPQGGLESSKTGRYVERPDNFWTVKIQPRAGSFAITVYGTSTQFSQAQSIEIKPDRGSYSRFNIWHEGQLDEAVLVINQAMSMKK